MTRSESNKPSPERLCIVCGKRFIGLLRCPTDSTALMVVGGEFVPGQIIGSNYEILEIIGKGGMSVVYKAKHKLMKRFVALKVLTASDAQSLKRFQMEAQLAAKLSHPNIVTVHDCGLQEGNKAWIAMDYVKGRTIADAIQKDGPIQYTRTLPLFLQACDALAYAHENGVIHRDLKPGNFMLVETETGLDQIKLLDFGIAKLLDPTEGDTQNLTASGQVFGSPLYMSPEQCLGQKLDARADVYSFGCVMYEVLTGRPPFVGKTPLETMQMHVKREAKPFYQVNDSVDIPRQLEYVVLKSLSRNLEKRYQSAQAVATDLGYVDSSLRAIQVKGVPSPTLESLTQDWQQRLPKPPAAQPFADQSSASIESPAQVCPEAASETAQPLSPFANTGAQSYSGSAKPLPNTETVASEAKKAPAPLTSEGAHVFSTAEIANPFVGPQTMNSASTLGNTGPPRPTDEAGDGAPTSPAPSTAEMTSFVPEIGGNLPEIATDESAPEIPRASASSAFKKLKERIDLQRTSGKSAAPGRIERQEGGDNKPATVERRIRLTSGSEPGNRSTEKSSSKVPPGGEWRSPAREVELPSVSAAVSAILGDTIPPTKVDLKVDENRLAKAEEKPPERQEPPPEQPAKPQPKSGNGTAGAPSNGDKSGFQRVKIAKPESKEPEPPPVVPLAKEIAAPPSVPAFDLKEAMKQFPIASILLILLAITLSIIGIILLSRSE